MSSFQVTGAEQFLRASKALKAAGELGLRKELHKAMRVAVKPLTPLTRAAAMEQLPKRGGMNVRVAKAKQTPQARTGARTAGVRLTVGKSGSGARGANVGVVRHPVFGDAKKWVDQPVPNATGWFDETCRQHAPTLVLPALEVALHDLAYEIARACNR